jgi:hypothetical protein
MTGSRGQVKEGGEGRKGRKVGLQGGGNSRKEGVILNNVVAKTCLSPIIMLVRIFGMKYFHNLG